MKRKVLLVGHICLIAFFASTLRAIAQDKQSTVKQTDAPADGTFKLVYPQRNAELTNRLETLRKDVETLRKDASPPPPPPPWFLMAIKGQPYSATAITEHMQTLSDGNQIIQKNEATYYRDSEGRTRIEQRLSTIGKWSAAGEPVRIIRIGDPVAGYNYQLDPRSRTARKDPFLNREELAREKQKRLLEVRMTQLTRSRELALEKQKLALDARLAQIDRCRQQAVEKQKRLLEVQQAERARLTESDREKQKMLLANERANLARLSEMEMEKKRRLEAEAAMLKQMREKKPTVAKPEPVEKGFKGKEKPGDRKKNESLGDQVIEGVAAEGTRLTTTIPAGEIGNTRPIAIVDERWYSNELRIVVMTKHSDPRAGETTYRLTNINRSEPDRSLFEVPAEYKIVDKTTQNIRKQ